MKMEVRKVTALTIIAIISLSEAYRVLVVFPVCSKSHNILAKGVITHLLEAEHEVVHITCYPEKKLIANLTELDVSFIEERFNKEEKRAANFKLKNLVGQKNFADSIMFLYMVYQINKEFLSEDVVTNFLADKNQQFDVVIAEWMFSELVSGIAPLFQSPLIWFGTTEAHWQILRIIDEIPNPAYNVDVFSSNKPPLSFLERANELWTVVRRFTLMNCILVPLEMYTYNKVYTPIAAKRGITMPAYSDVVYNASLMFINSHTSFGTPLRLPPNAIYVGGYHIDNKVKALPKDLQKIMDEAKHGVIYFSMGSNLKSMDMSDHMKNSLLKVFSKLKQTVIWKFEGKIANKPANIHLMSWAPQQSILAHPNTKVFITHGGQLSTTEAIHFGIPVIGIPVFGDQYINMKSAEDKGFGIIVNLAEDMADELEKAIQEILNNLSYTNKAKELSQIYHARPVHPGKELVHWVDQVILTQGALHLRSAALSTPFYQKVYLDLFATISIVVYILYRLVKKCLYFKKSVNKNVKKTKKS